MIRIKDHNNKAWYSIISIFLLSFCVNLLGLGNTILVPIGAVLLFVYSIFIRKTRYFLGLFLVLFTLLLSYLFFTSFFDFDSLNAKLRLFFLPTGLLLFGYLCLKKKNYEENYLNLVILLLFGMSLYGLLCLRNTNQVYGDFSNAMMMLNNRRMLLTIWDNQLITATGITTYLAPSLSVLPMLFVLPKKRFFVQKIFIILSFLMAAFITLILANRTGLLIIAISFFVSVGLLIIHKDYKSLVFFISVFLMIFFLVVSLFPGLFLDNFELIINRLKNASLSGDSRFSAWFYILGNLPSVFAGGRNLNLPNRVNYVHNFFLDIIFYGGVVPFIFSIWFMIKSFFAFPTSLKYSYEKFLFYLVFLGFIMVFMVEPILQGWIVSFSCFCFFIGITAKFTEYKTDSLRHRLT